MSDTLKTDGSRALDEGAVWKAVLVMAAPMVFGIAALKSVSIIDTLYIGQLGKDQLAAISFAFPVTTIILGLMLGLSIGAASVVSRAFGERDEDAAKHLALHTILLMLLMTLVVAIIGTVMTRPIFMMLGASDATLGYITGYMRLYFMAVPFAALAMICDFIMRATGNSLWPSIVMTAGSVFNIGITACLVFGLWIFPELGMEGAAAGTLIAQILMALTTLWLVSTKADIVTWTLPKLKTLLPSWKKTLKVGLPAALGNMVHPFTLTAITAILATFSEDIVAAFGVATQIEMIGVIPLLALSAALSPIAGQNWGAGKPDRIIMALRQSYWLCVIWCGLIACLLWFLGEPVAALFNDEADIPAEAQTYLRLVPLSLFGYGMVICAASVFNGIDEANRALGYNIVRSLVLFLPLAWIGSRVSDVSGVYAGMAAANIMSGLAVGWYAIHWLNRNGGQARDGQQADAAPDCELSPSRPC